MIKDEKIRILLNNAFVTDIVFKYKGKNGLIMPEGKGKYFLSYGSPEEDSGRYVYGQENILTTANDIVHIQLLLEFGKEQDNCA